MDLNSEVQMLALSDSKRVHVFNLEDEFSYLMTMEVPNVTYIAFMDCYILLLQESDDSDESVL